MGLAWQGLKRATGEGCCVLQEIKRGVCEKQCSQSGHEEVELNESREIMTPKKKSLMYLPGSLFLDKKNH